MKSSVSNIIVFDLETGGLKAEENPILEIAFCPIDFNGNDLEEYTSGIMNVYGGLSLTDGALNANGISREQISAGRDSKEVFKEVSQFLKKMAVGKNKPVLAGHNIDKFDIPFLDKFFSFHGEDMQKYVNFDLTIDTMWWARLRWEERENFKLGTCCSSVGIELVNAHRALNDTRANKELVKYFLKNLRSESNNEEKKVTRYRNTFEF